MDYLKILHENPDLAEEDVYKRQVQNKNQELADYLKSLEPEDWHNEQEKVRCV